MTVKEQVHVGSFSGTRFTTLVAQTANDGTQGVSKVLLDGLSSACVLAFRFKDAI